MKYLWNYTKKYRRFYFLAVAAMCVSIGLDMMAPQIIRMLIDDVITAGRMELFGGLVHPNLYPTQGCVATRYLVNTH